MYKVQVLAKTINQKVPGYSAHSTRGTEKEALLPTSTQKTWGTTLHCASAQLGTLKWYTSPTVHTRGIAWINFPCRMLSFALGLNHDDVPNTLGHAVEIFAKITEKPMASRAWLLKNTWNKSIVSPPASVAEVTTSSHIYSTKIPALPVPILRSLFQPWARWTSSQKKGSFQNWD